jgi:hypothetical protein
MSDTKIEPGAGELKADGYPPAMQLFQFCGLMWATEYNAREAGLEKGIDAQTVNAMNALLMAFAALEALVLETALVVHPALYGDRQFRRAGIIEQYERYLEVDGRRGEEVPPVVAEVSRHRVALTHSEPDHERSFVLSEVISATDAERFAREVRRVAEWLWRGKRPGAVAAAFDGRNVFFEMKGNPARSRPFG